MARWKVTYRQLKNRRVIRTAVVYLAFVWGAIEVADLLADADIIRGELVRRLLLLGVLGFPATLVLSWFFESPWRERRWISVVGDVAVILVISLAAVLLVREHLFTSFTRPVIAVLKLEATDMRPDTGVLARHLAERFRMLLATRPEVRVVEIDSSHSPALASLPLTAKAVVLGADFLIGGTVNQGNEEVRLNLQLFAADGKMLWSDSFHDRLIDQAQLQNSVLNEIWHQLPLPPRALRQVRDLVATCEYPADTEAIRAIMNTGSVHDTDPASRLTSLDDLIKAYRDSGLLHLARARTYFDQLESVPVTRAPVIQNLAMRDLDRAREQCPGHPDIGLLRLYNTLQTRGPENERSGLISQYPNESDLHLELAGVYLASGDMKTAKALAAQAWALDPLDAHTLCAYRQLLSAEPDNSAADLLRLIERRLITLPETFEMHCQPAERDPWKFGDRQTSLSVNGN